MTVPWQIRTFWFALLWLALGGALFLTVVGIIRGWLAFSSTKELPY